MTKSPVDSSIWFIPAQTRTRLSYRAIAGRRSSHSLAPDRTLVRRALRFARLIDDVSFTKRVACVHALRSSATIVLSPNCTTPALPHRRHGGYGPSFPGGVPVRRHIQLAAGAVHCYLGVVRPDIAGMFTHISKRQDVCFLSSRNSRTADLPTDMDFPRSLRPKPAATAAVGEAIYDRLRRWRHG